LCYTKSNSSSGNITSSVNATLLNGTLLNGTLLNGTLLNGTVSRDAPSVRRCEGARSALHCRGLKRACLWDTLRRSCRDAGVAGDVHSIDGSNKGPSVRARGAAEGRNGILAPVAGGVLAVASVVGVALVRLRRSKKARGNSDDSDAERVPIVRSCGTADDEVEV